ncbi:prolow-density lipoprotein receptor-related protein 1-like isoform X1 [Strongylocentrotus purpuratus]|uniref:HYR domain-containing protein n=1 Tax=Strongylocentrotus purpuratus TaxID=7668 RepID=A0A7M7NNP7_STRPU|nr:prolow-density lipoprotein receptor-related protein 1-like isoform X1 [Strongylocentrotus purpuratus]
MARGGIWHISVLVYAIFGFHMNTAQIFIGDSNTPGILYASLPEPRDDTYIMDTRFTLIRLSENRGIDGIDYDPENEMVYWNDFSGSQISRIQLDGTNQEVIISTSSPHSIALDLVNGKIYWTMYNDKAISRANLDGSSVEELFKYTSFAQPTSILVDPVSGFLLWSTRLVNQVVKATLNATNEEVVRPIYAEGMFNEECADDTTRLFYYTEKTKLGVTNLDGSGNRIIKVFSEKTMGSSLSKYGSKLFWSAQSRSPSFTLTGLINEYDMKSSTLTIHNSTVTLLNGDELVISPLTTRIISHTPYNEPVAIEGCPDNIVVNIDENASNASSISWTEPGLNSWSSCPTMVFQGTGTNGGDFSLGITELSYRASDAAGNTDDCQFSVTVRRSSADETLPPTTGQPTTGQPTTGQPSGSTALVTSCSSVLLVLCIALFLIVLK